uniref:Fatty acyl-CoA reductase n=1 Tax=Quercus lobata TaxID=97700 RepID=A0A7N2QXA0_QUELO
MWKEIDIVLNSTTTTNFDERYDVALGINTYGALHVLSFAQNCVKLKVLLHVSTTYVCVEKGGNILESPFYMGDTLKGTSKLEINAKKELVKEYLDTWIDYKYKAPRMKQIISTMKDFGIERTIDGVIFAYAKEKLEYFKAHPKSILDIIPADMVVNSMTVAMVAHANKSSQIIFHAGSSLRNPMRLYTLKEFLFRMARFHAYMAIRYKLPLKVLWLANEVLCQQYYRDTYIDSKRKVEVDNSFLIQYSFDDSNTEKLQVAARESDADMHLFDFDPKRIEWGNYVMNFLA